MKYSNRAVSRTSYLMHARAVWVTLLDYTKTVYHFYHLVHFYFYSQKFPDYSGIILNALRFLMFQKLFQHMCSFLSISWFIWATHQNLPCTYVYVLLECLSPSSSGLVWADLLVRRCLHKCTHYMSSPDDDFFKVTKHEKHFPKYTHMPWCAISNIEMSYNYFVQWQILLCTHVT